MILASVFGVILMQASQQYSWDYWQVLTLFFAALCIFLGCYHRSKKGKQILGTIFHEILHWTGLLISVYLVTKMVTIGIMGRFQASLTVMLFLAFSTFLAGVYVVFPLMFVGAFIGISALFIAFFNEYLYSIFIPFAGILLLFWLLHAKLSHKPNEPSK